MAVSRRELGRFYTPPNVARELVAMIEATPRTVLDLGCGHGVLSRAVVKRWGDALSLTTLDIDPHAGPQGKSWATQHRHYLCDILDFDSLAAAIGRGRFDLAILNPPYGRRPSDLALREQSNTSGVAWASMRCRSTLFVMHALKSVCIGGTVAAIIPETLAAGQSSQASRRVISSLGAIERIVALPAKTFPYTEARTVMVVMRRLIEREGDTTPWLHHPSTPLSSERWHRALSTIGELGVQIVRGRLNTTQARSVGAFHLGTFRTALGGVVSFPPTDDCQDDRAAQKGDILVARIGRRIADKVALVTAGSSAISDCVYRLRCPPAVVERVFNGLRSPDGKQQMEAALSGTTTRLLPMGGLLALRV